MGTPDFGKMALCKMVEQGYNIVGVFTQVDKPRDRLKVECCAIKQEAIKLCLPVFSFAKLRDQDGIEAIRELKPDLIITAAFGQILSQDILNIPTLGVFNIHASLLPKYRGGCPIQWAIINGEKETGITIMRTVLALDAGDIILQKSLPIDEKDTYATLYHKLSCLGSECMMEVLKKQRLNFISQIESESTYYPVIKKIDGEINFSKTATQICNLIRGLNPNPTAYTYYDGVVLKIYFAEIVSNFDEDYFEQSNVKIGQVIVSNKKDGLIIKCGEGSIEIIELQLPSKKRMNAKEFLLGNIIPIGTILGK